MIYSQRLGELSFGERSAKVITEPRPLSTPGGHYWHVGRRKRRFRHTEAVRWENVWQMGNGLVDNGEILPSAWLGSQLRMAAPPLTLDAILDWCDLHRKRRGKFPVYTAGPVVDGPLGLNWRIVDNALRHGLRGLEGGSSLARLLAEHRGYRNVQALPPLTEEEQIEQWAIAHMDRAGTWPNEDTGEIPEAPGETWCNINAALREGNRGLPGNDSLAELLARQLGMRTQVAVPALSVATILVWAGEHKAAMGHWPREGIPGLCWAIQERRGRPSMLRLKLALGAYRPARHWRSSYTSTTAYPTRAGCRA